MEFKELSDKILKQAEVKGFGTSPDEISVAEKTALIHSEVSEMFDAYRKKRFEGKHCFKEELADIVARTLHLAGIFDINIEEELLKKLEINKEREWDWKNINESHS